MPTEQLRKLTHPEVEGEIHHQLFGQRESSEGKIEEESKRIDFALSVKNTEVQSEYLNLNLDTPGTFSRSITLETSENELSEETRRILQRANRFPKQIWNQIRLKPKDLSSTPESQSKNHPFRQTLKKQLYQNQPIDGTKSVKKGSLDYSLSQRSTSKLLNLDSKASIDEAIYIKLENEPKYFDFNPEEGLENVRASKYNSRKLQKGETPF